MIQTNFTPFPVLTTDHLTLRQLETTDDGAIFAHRANDSVNAYLQDFRHSTIEQTRAFIDRVRQEIAAGKSILWVITLQGSKQLIGTICLWNIAEQEQKAETGYTLDPGFQGRGYMQEALAEVIRFGFDTMKLKTIEAYTHENNQSSIRLLQRNKFKPGIPEKEAGNHEIFFSLHHESA